MIPRLLPILSILLLLVMHGQAQLRIPSIDSIARAAVASDFFEGTILVADNGNVVYHESFGFVDTDKVTPTTNTARYGIASITKMFTAIIVLQLVEEKKLQLTDNLADLLPDLQVPKAKKITIHHLLLHISGLPNEDDAIYYQTKSPVEFINETLKNRGSKFGEFNYANIDYILLGLIIEKYDNTTWHNSVKRRILDKLSMNDSGFLASDNYPDRFAYTFSYDDGGNRQADPLFFIENFYAAGCMYSSATDLLKLDQAMYGSELLTEESKDLLYTSYPEYNYSGYSVWTYNYPYAKSKPRVMERRGSILGSNSVLVRMLDTNKTLIILSNNNKFNPDSFGNTNGLKEALMIEMDRVDS